MKIGMVASGLLIFAFIIASLILEDGWGSRLFETKKVKQERLKAKLQEEKF